MVDLPDSDRGVLVLPVDYVKRRRLVIIVFMCVIEKALGDQWSWTVVLPKDGPRVNSLPVLSSPSSTMYRLQFRARRGLVKDRKDGRSSRHESSCSSRGSTRTAVDPGGG